MAIQNKYAAAITTLKDFYWYNIFANAGQCSLVCKQNDGDSH